MVNNECYGLSCVTLPKLQRSCMQTHISAPSTEQRAVQGSVVSGYTFNITPTKDLFYTEDAV